MIEERLLGFDIREQPPGFCDLWDDVRREVFLLRLDSAVPLSVDTMVWPSLFDTGQGIGLPDEERERLHLAGVPIPLWIGPSGLLWEDLEGMRRHLAENRRDPPPHADIAVSWFSDAAFAGAGDVGPYLAAVDPLERNPAWGLLGYDVADGSFVSALSNCGYSPEQVSYLRRSWGPLLNESHLFADLEPAFKFRDLSNARVPEHAPFFVFGVYMVKAT